MRRSTRKPDQQINHEAIQKGWLEVDQGRAVRELLECLECSNPEDLAKLHPVTIPAAKRVAELFGYKADIGPLSSGQAAG